MKQIFTLNLFIIFFIGLNSKSNAAVSCHQMLSKTNNQLISNFKLTQNLGSETEIILIVKKSKKDSKINAHRKKIEQMELTGDTSLYSENSDPYKGFVSKTRLSEINNIDNSKWKNTGDAPHGYVANKEYGIIAFTNKLQIIDPKTGKELAEINSPWFRNLHSVDFIPGQQEWLIVANTGLNNILKVNVRNKEVQELWDPLENGHSEIRPRLHLVFAWKKNNDKKFNRELTFKEAQEFVLDNNTRSVPENESWAIVINWSDLSPLGLPRWLRTVYPNWVGFKKNSNKILATFYGTNQAVEIDPNSGKVRIMKDGLKRPHGVIPYSDNFIISDTQHGQVLIVDQNGNTKQQVDFSQEPANELTSSNKEWVQLTNPIGDTGLLATIDSRRNKIYVWHPDQKIYSEYDFNPEWEIQSVQNITNKNDTN